MNPIRLAILMSPLLFFTSCKEDSVNPVDVTGDWQSEEVHVNGKLQEDISKSTWLLLKKDNIFQRNYVIGTWSLNKRNLELAPNADSSIQSMQYEVTDLSETFLTLKITLTEREYGWDFKNIEDDDLITVTEKYTKRQ